MYQTVSYVSTGGVEAVVVLIMATLAVSTLFLSVVPFWFICKKAGFSPWLCLVNLVPLGVFVLPWILAFSSWPALRKNAENFPSGG